MIDFEKFHDLQQAAIVHFRASENMEGIAVQSQLAEQMLGLGLQPFLEQPRLKSLLQDVTNELIDMMRWEGLYDQAIALQERLVEFFPESVDIIRMGVANLKIESGREEVGLAEIRQLAENDPENFWIRISLGAGYLWLRRFDEAEVVFKQTASLTDVRNVDRAEAQKYLFNLYAAQEGRSADAEAAWREGCRLNPKMRDMLPQVVRMLTYWRDYDRAKKQLSKERNRIRHLFYQGLIIGEYGNMKAASGYWRSILVDIPFENLDAGQDEYAEACIRLVNPSIAISILEPLIQANQVNYFRLVILGLAWAQKQATERAAWYLRHALRVGDLERPRKTRGAPQGRILDIYARLLYYDIIVNKEVREELDYFFIPEKPIQV